jgi:hypothetical protein
MAQWLFALSRKHFLLLGSAALPARSLNEGGAVGAGGGSDGFSTSTPCQWLALPTSSNGAHCRQRPFPETANSQRTLEATGQ